ncbi:MAG: glycoside hydrolase family 3 C-terminal domain-containing protein [Bacilli bacterium]|nr:glycoside hydrolase family 3 C-terminal domain-containing protein [Bacilli bacterium]
MKKLRKPKYFLYAPLIAIFGILLGATFFVDNAYGNTMRAALSETQIDEELQKEAHEDAVNISKELVEEGSVLLFNNANTLPLQKNSKINLFGVKSVDLSYNASGSAASSGNIEYTLKQGLESVGFEINSNLYDLISKNTTTSDTDVHEGGESVAVPELALDKYTGNTAFDQLKTYSDQAVVVIGRLAGEGGDISRTGFGTSGTESYLALSTNEKALLQKLEEEGFTTTVLLNTSYPMEVGIFEDPTYGVDACLWIGGPGAAGCPGIGTILNGDVSPSGRLVDTWAYDLKTGSTYYNSSTYNYVYDKNGSYADAGGWTEYNEGIYFGYRWYETADSVGYWDKSPYTGYNDVVQFPFGYGKSYTTFSQSFAETPTVLNNKVTFKVNVKNEGTEYSGKDVIQIYAETPYVTGGVEKSKVVICAFAKTSKLAPGASEQIELEINLEDLASYDETANDGEGAYVLDEGNYKFYLSNNAHGWKDPLLNYDTFESTLNKVVYSGENKRSSDKNAAKNQFNKGNLGNLIDIDNGINTITRANNFDDASTILRPTYTSVTLNGRSTNVRIIASNSEEYKYLVTDAKKTPAYQGAEFESTTTNASKTYSFEDMWGVEYDDPKWEEFISELSMNDLSTLIGSGGWGNAAIKSIGKVQMVDIDGPFGLSNYIKTSMNESTHCMSYCTEVVMASTFNTELIERLGKTIGKEANASGTAGWYAPGLNTHRTPFGGRNAEYFSEDPLLAGLIGAAEVKGVQSNGVYVFLKHFAFNDVEANRTNKENCYLTEQTAREIYLKAFEIPVKKAKATGLMTSYMWINGNWGGANYALNVQVLRNEWGLEGAIITDNFCGGWMTASKGVVGGTDLMLSVAVKQIDDSLKNTDNGVKLMKTAAKHILYAIASVQNNRLVALKDVNNPWPPIMVTLICVSSAGILASAGFLVFEILRYNKHKKLAPTEE